MRRDRFENWLHQIYHTQEDEISCSECFELVSRYVELELSGEQVEQMLPQVKQHLLECIACREEYETLRDLQRMDNEGDAPSIDDLQDMIQ